MTEQRTGTGPTPPSGANPSLHQFIRRVRVSNGVKLRLGHIEVDVRRRPRHWLGRWGIEALRD